MEKVYKTMQIAGAAGIAIGIVVAAVGVTAGVLSIVTGAALLRRKSDISF